MIFKRTLCGQCKISRTNCLQVGNYFKPARASRLMAQAQETQRAVSKWFVFWPFLGQKWFALSWFFFLWPVFDLITLKTLPSRKVDMSPYFSSSCCWYCFDATLAPVSISLNHLPNCTNTAPHNSLPKPALCTEALPPPFLTSLSKLSRVLATQILQ